ncbi:MAG TPA: hypothetical protein PLO23_08545, partial [Alphaproteobacteria bacterium]|nr:hypothetical protein [Alphaproteobacteria bacterium]
MKRMDDLRDIMLPFLAAHCNWPTLHKILGNDPALKAFWDKQVAPTAPKVKSDADIQSAILSYLPRGGFRVPELDAFVKISADPPAARTNFNTRDIEAVIKATLAHGFAGEYDPEIYNDRSFAKLGRNRHPRHEPDPDHYTFEQATAVMALGALGDGVVPLDRPKTYLYLDDPAGGHAAAAYMQRTGIVDPTQIGAAYDVHGNPGESFGDVVGRESSADFVDRQRELGLAHEYAQFRRDKGIGNILSLTDFRGALNYTGRREATDTEAHEAVAADGSMHQSKDTLEAVARRATTLAMDGIIIPAGMTSSLQARIIGEALTVAIGKVQRGGENMNYQMEFLMDFGYLKPADKRSPQDIKKLDLADLIIHFGIQVKALLEQPNTPACPDLYITMARLLDVYERMIDPARRNTVVDRDPRTGKDKRKEIIAIDEIDPYFKEFISSRSPVASYQETGDHHIDNPARDAFFSRPEYKALAAPEASKPKDFYKQLLSRTSSLGGLGAKAALAHDIWAWMRAAAIPSPSGKPGQNWAVTGNLLARGIQYFDDMSLTDLHPDYRAAQTAWGNLNARQRANIFGQHQLQVEGPTVAR